MTGTRGGQPGIRSVTRWLALLVGLVAGTIALHRILAVFERHLAVGVVAALVWVGLYAWQQRVRSRRRGSGSPSLRSR